MPENLQSAEDPPSGAARLPRRLGLADAVAIGVGSIVGTGLYVTLGRAAATVGWQILAVVAVAGLLALFNGTSSARLAAAFPVSGGTYEYGYRVLRPVVGFGAGWVFVVGKVASAATAVLGASEYAVKAFALSGNDGGGALRILLAVAMALGIGGALAAGHRVTRLVNVVLLSVSFAALSSLAVAAFATPSLVAEATSSTLGPFGMGGVGRRDWLHAVAIVFVAFTGYGRIATLGEEVKDPAKTIPRAIGAALLIAASLYLLLAAALIHRLGPTGLATMVAQGDAPPLGLANSLGVRWLPGLVTVGAVASMACVCANLILGISRVLVAMGRRGDLPERLAHLSSVGGEPTPRRAVLTTALLVAALAALGHVAFTWDLSAFTILVYYGVTHVAAARLSRNSMLRARARPFAQLAVWAGGSACFALAWWVTPAAWITGTGALVVGLVWREVWRSRPAGGAPR